MPSPGRSVLIGPSSSSGPSGDCLAVGALAFCLAQKSRGCADI